MKKQSPPSFAICLILSLLTVCASSLQAQTSAKSSKINTSQATSNKLEKSKTIKLEVKGMSCRQGCANGLDATLKKVSGIIKSKTSFDNNNSEITFDELKITEKEIIAIVEKRGFKAKLIENTNK